MANLAGKRRNRNYNLADLPLDLQIKIVSLIASVSITDLFNTTQTCKSLYKAGSHPIVLQNAAVWPKFYAIHTRRLQNKEEPEIDAAAAGGVARFVKQCMKSSNPEAMLCLRTEEYFFRDERLCKLDDEKRREEAMRCLRTADSKGHVAAKMLFGMIYLIAGGREEDEEFGIVAKMFGSREAIGECCRAGKFMADCVKDRRLRRKSDGWLGIEEKLGDLLKIDVFIKYLERWLTQMNRNVGG